LHTSLLTRVRRRLGALPWPGQVRALWRFRSFVWGSVRRDVLAQFQGSLLGVGWMVVHPLALIAMYTLVFSNVMGSRLAGFNLPYAYSIFLCAGLLPWTYHAESLGRLQGAFVNNANLIKKATFPRICLPLIAVGLPTANFLLISLIFLVFLLVSGLWPGWALGWLVPVLAVQMTLTLSLGVLAATLNVFFRDVGQLVSVSLLFWFWLTPVVYPITVLPAAVREWLWLNPFAVLAQHYQHVMLHQAPAPLSLWFQLAGWGLASLLMFSFAMVIYRARSPEMADEL